MSVKKEIFAAFAPKAVKKIIEILNFCARNVQSLFGRRIMQERLARAREEAGRRFDQLRLEGDTV